MLAICHNDLLQCGWWVTSHLGLVPAIYFQLSAAKRRLPIETAWRKLSCRKKDVGHVTTSQFYPLFATSVMQCSSFIVTI